TFEFVSSVSGITSHESQASGMPSQSISGSLLQNPPTTPPEASLSTMHLPAQISAQSRSSSQVSKTSPSQPQCLPIGPSGILSSSDGTSGHASQISPTPSLSKSFCRTF